MTDSAEIVPAQCDYCHHPCLPAEPQSVLLCQHTVHTRCFLKANCQDSPRYLQCPTCHQPLTPPNLLQELHIGDEETVSIQSGNSHQNTQILEMYNNQEPFRKAVKDYHKQVLAVSKANTQLTKVIRARRTVFKQQVQEMKEAIESLAADEKKKIKDSPAYKLFGKEQRRLERMAKDIRTNYHVSSYQLRTNLQGTPGFRKWPRIWRNRRNAIHYAFYLRIH